MPKKNTATVRRTASRTRSSSPPPPMGLIVTANAAECSASSACGLDNRSHRTPLIPQLPATSHATVPQYSSVHDLPFANCGVALAFRARVMAHEE